MQDQFPFNIQDKIEDRAWIKNRQDEISEELEKYQSQKQVYSVLLKDSLNPHKTIH